MKRVMVGIAAAAILAGTQLTLGQGQGNPFVDHSDNGETIHVLPSPASIHSPRDTQPTDAPPRNSLSVFPASYGSGDLINHGGPQVSLAQFVAIYWNSAVANTTFNGKALHTIVSDFAVNFSNSPSYTVIQQYGTAATPIAPQLAFAEFIDSQKAAKSINDSSVRSYVASLFTRPGSPLSPDSNTVYGVYFPSGMTISTQGGRSCTSFCGYHGHFSYNGIDIKYAVFPYTDCRACSLSGKTVADILTIVSSHEIREAVTDPDLNSWFDSAGYEADDKCAWHNLYKLSNGAWVQPEYSNGLPGYPGPGCIVP